MRFTLSWPPFFFSWRTLAELLWDEHAATVADTDLDMLTKAHRAVEDEKTAHSTDAAALIEQIRHLSD